MQWIEFINEQNVWEITKVWMLGGAGATHMKGIITIIAIKIMMAKTLHTKSALSATNATTTITRHRKRKAVTIFQFHTYL